MEEASSLALASPAVDRSEAEDRDEDEDAPDKPKKKAQRHSLRSTKILKDWFAANKAYPYPTDEEKDRLSQSTGLSHRQISYWFVNARRRNSAKSDDTPAVVPVQIPGTELSSHVPHVQGWIDMTPLDRWRASPPEEEPLPSHVIDQLSLSLASGPDPGEGHGESFSFNEDVAGPRSIVFSELSNQSQSGDSSANSHSYSSGSVASLYSHDQGRRRRRRRRRWSQSQWQRRANSAKDPSRIFQCTFCTDTFKSRYDWTRHEGTLHLVLEKWTCLPFGPRHSEPSEGIIRCALCDAVDPSDSHLQAHSYSECTAKPLSKRSFYRKDHLRQHLRISHGVGDLLPSMKSWKSKVTHVKSRCGFCGETFTSWADRNDHLADHYRAGAMMKDWKGCRGLEPAIALLVQNAIPPYLIGAESNDPEPFSASRSALKAGADPVGSTLPTAFESLTARLGEYVNKAREQGTAVTAVTDDMLRREARILMYSDDDPLNYTPADNPVWLDLFKQGHGLAPVRAQLDAAHAGASFDFGASSLQQNSAQAMIMSPFTLEKMLHAAVSDSTAIPLDFCGGPLLQGQSDPDIVVPWSWQTPECLAEFRQMCQTTSPGMAASEGQMYPLSVSVGPGLMAESVAGNPIFGGNDILEPACGRDGPLGGEVEQKDMDLFFHSHLFDDIMAAYAEQGSQEIGEASETQA